MKYLKTYETHKELLKSLKSLSGEMNRLKTLVNMERRRITPNEIFEDYFLEFKELEKFRVNIYNNTNGIGPIHFELYNMIDKDIIESEFYRFLRKLQSIQQRLEYQKFECLFKIGLNGRSQADLDPIKHKNDDYKFKGLGSSKWGYDSKNYYSDTDAVGHSLPFPEDKVSVRIDFYII